MPTLHHEMFHISPVLRCFRKCAKMRTFESERVNCDSNGFCLDSVLRLQLHAILKSDWSSAWLLNFLDATVLGCLSGIHVKL